MGGCVASKLGEEQQVVAICRERKRLMKLAVERRYSLADAHCRYIHSLCAVSAAIRVFVVRHSSPTSPFLITFESDCNNPQPNGENFITTCSTSNNPMFLQHKPCESTQKTIKPCSCSESTTESEEEEDGDEDEEEDEDGEDEQQQQQQQREGNQNVGQQGAGYFYMGTGMGNYSNGTGIYSNGMGNYTDMGMGNNNNYTGMGNIYTGMVNGAGMGMPPPMPSPQRDFGWDFFDPFSGVVRPEVITGYNRGGGNSDDHLRAVREQEGIPELEEESGGVATAATEKKNKQETVTMVVENGGIKENRQTNGENSASGAVKAVENGCCSDVCGGGGAGNKGENGGLTGGGDSPVQGRELLEALRDIEDHFSRAYNSGNEVSTMLEANKVQLTSGFEEIKENSTKLIQAITWHKSNISSRSSSSCRSLVASSSKNSSSCSTDSNKTNDIIFDVCGGMAAGSHLLTLGRLYAWEKKLYDEVKAGDDIRKLYEKKCMQLRNKNVKGYDVLSMDKSRAAAKELYSRILVAIRRAESISEKIQKLMTEELQPQIIELLQGLTRSWKTMLECHETQNRIISEVKAYDCPTYGKFCGESHRLATCQLEAEIQNWRECFLDFVSVQRSYIEALHGWLSKFVVPEVEFSSSNSSRGSSGRGAVPSPFRANGPPLYTLCHDWLTYMHNLPDKAVSVSLKSFAKDLRALWVQQGEELDQKRRVDKLAKEFDRKMLAYQKAAESRSLHHADIKLLEYKPSEEQQQLEEDCGDDYVKEKKDSLESLRRKLDLERERHHDSMNETQRSTLNGFKIGFGLIFEALVQFSKASHRMYNELGNGGQNVDNPSCLESSNGTEDNGNK